MKGAGEQFVQLRVVLLEPFGLFEEVLGHYGEELGFIGSGVGVYFGFAGLDSGNFALHHRHPGLEQFGRQGGFGHAVNHAIGLIEQMRKFVNAHILAVQAIEKTLFE